jgi:hypothetical protein
VFERARDNLRKKLGRHTAYAAPAVADPETARTLRDDLEDFYDRSESRFSELFLDEKPLMLEADEKPRFDLYERAGLVREKTSNIYLPCVRLFPLAGAFIATDLATHHDEDQVFPLMLEQIYIVRQMRVRRGDRALELCVGSGVNCLFLSDLAASVTGVDLSARALAFARFNVTLNPGGAEVDLRQGSLFEPIDAGERFDYVLVNPPFEPVPPGSEHFMHSHGGEDGLDVVREILAKAPHHLAPGARFEMFTWSPGDDASVLVADLLRDAFPDRRIEVQLVDSRPLDERIERFRADRGFAEWRGRLIAAGYTRIADVFVRVEGDGPAETAVVERPEVFDHSMRIIDEWDDRRRG